MFQWSSFALKQFLSGNNLNYVAGFLWCTFQMIRSSNCWLLTFLLVSVSIVSLTLDAQRTNRLPKLRSIVPAVTGVSLCRYQREHDQAWHLVVLPFPFWCPCCFWSWVLHFVEGSEVETSLVMLHRAVLFVFGACARHDRDPESDWNAWSCVGHETAILRAVGRLKNPTLRCKDIKRSDNCLVLSVMFTLVTDHELDH